MFDNDKLDNLVARGGFGSCLMPHEVADVIEEGVNNGILNDNIEVRRLLGGNIALQLNLSDEVRLISDAVSPRHFVSTNTDDTARDMVRVVLRRAEEILTEMKEAAVGARQADWRSFPILLG